MLLTKLLVLCTEQYKLSNLNNNQMKLERIYRADKILNYVCERFEREGDIIRKVATPGFTGTAHNVACPGNNVIKEVQDHGSNGLTFLFTVEQTPALLLTQIFPGGVMVGDQNIEVAKPLLLENKGGEYITVNLNNITSTEILNVNISTNKPLVVEETTKFQNTKYRQVRTKYRQVSYTYFNGYDDSKSIQENYNDGVFDSLFQIETAPFYVNYTQKLDTPRVWKDGQKQVYYSRYCILTPENKAFKYHSQINLLPSSSKPTRITVYKTENTNRETVQAFSSIFY